DLLHLPYFLCEEALPNGVEFAAFGVEKGTPWIKEAMEYYQNRPFIIKEGIYDELAIPIAIMTYLSSKYEFVPIQSLSEFVNDSSKICYLPNDWFNAHPRDDVKGLYYNITENTHCIHHFANSWLEDEYGGGPLHKMYYKITGKNWRLRDGRFQLYGTDKKIKI
ncbi:MAG: hypothetical protein J6Z27_04830, partial [Bacteroidales bacterium]|nr:hypothetical protein [Bacteroidales bacterium]